MTIVWGEKAYDDLDEIVEYLANLSPEAADKTISRIQKTVVMLADFPGWERKWTRPDSTGWLSPTHRM